MIDGVAAGVIDRLEHAASHVPGVARVTDARARWIGHRMRAEVAVAVDPNLSVAEGHQIAKQVEAKLRLELDFLSSAIVHVDPMTESGEAYHQVPGESPEHGHDSGAHQEHGPSDRDHGHGRSYRT